MPKILSTSVFFVLSIETTTFLLGHTISNQLQLSLASSFYEGLYSTDPFKLPTKNVRGVADVAEDDPVRPFLSRGDILCPEIVYREVKYKHGDLGNICIFMIENNLYYI